MAIKRALARRLLKTISFSAEQRAAIPQTREIKEREILERAVKEREAAEAEKRKAQKEREVALRALTEEYKLQDADAKAKQRQEEKHLRAWETMQRFKRDEYDKRTILEERERQSRQKLEYGNELRKDAVRGSTFLYYIYYIMIRII